MSKPDTTWRPIKTAKRHKKPILGYCVPVDDPYKRPAGMAVIWWGKDDPVVSPGWQGTPTCWHKPTHWMSLPEVP